MSSEELTNTLDDLPKRLHDLYGFEILGAGDTGRPPRLQIGRTLRGTFASLLIDDTLDVHVGEVEITFTNRTSCISINKQEYHVQISDR
jgi:hypothetical protein